MRFDPESGLILPRSRREIERGCFMAASQQALLMANQGGDVNFSSVSLLLHGNGTDTSTTITDSSSNARTATLIGNVQIDTGQSKFGGASIQFDGVNDGLSYAHYTGFEFGTGACTWEFWVRINTLAEAYPIAFKWNNAAYDTYVQISSAGKLSLIIQSVGIISTANGALTTGTWYYVAVTRSGTTWKMVYGTSGSTTTVGTSTTGGGADPGTNNAMLVGCLSTGGFLALDGWMDDVRITKGVARDVSNVPTTEFPNN